MNPNRIARIGDLNGVLENIVKNSIYLVGVAVVVMLVVGGLQYLMAGGDKEATQKASKTITFAIIGLILVLCSWLIIKLIGSFLGLDLTDFGFTICLPGQSC